MVVAHFSDAGALTSPSWPKRVSSSCIELQDRIFVADLAMGRPRSGDRSADYTMPRSMRSCQVRGLRVSEHGSVCSALFGPSGRGTGWVL